MIDMVSPDYPLIVPFDERHIERAADLWANRFGGLENQAESWLKDACIDTESNTQGFVALDPGFAGFGVTTIAGPEYTLDYINADVDFVPWERTGINHILVVDEAHESEGIGSLLVKKRLEWLAAMDVGGVVGISWHREGHHDSRPLFEKHGFDAVATVEEYYAKLDGPCPCVDCEGVCRCDATIYARPLNGGEN